MATVQRTVLIGVAAVLLSLLAGCTVAGHRTFLTVDFQESQTLRYKFVSRRNIDTQWEPGKTSSSSESVEMIVAYTPIDINPYGLTTIEATCESVKASRTAATGRQTTKADAVKSLAGQIFNFTVDSTGRIADYSQLNKLLYQAGENAFRKSTKAGRVKDPDMIADFIATQWFLWDPVASIQNPAKGLTIGQKWTSKLSVPTSMILQKARNVTYKLAEIRQSENGRIAVIESSYSAAESVPKGWPMPYTGQFQLAGPFGFFLSILKGFNVKDLNGQGTELFNIDAGRTEQYNQNYQMTLGASAPGPLGLDPKITIVQELTMQLLE